jgi:hypothetical protein
MHVEAELGKYEESVEVYVERRKPGNGRNKEVGKVKD